MQSRTKNRTQAFSRDSGSRAGHQHSCALAKRSETRGSREVRTLLPRKKIKKSDGEESVRLLLKPAS